MEHAENCHYLSFSLDGERYAVSIDRVQEVLEYSPITRLPRMESYMKGIINLRGTGIPVIDLRLRFGMPQTPIGKDTAIIVMELEHDGANAVVGVLADAVHEVVELPEASIEPPPRLGAGLASRHIRGVGKHDDGFMIVIDIDGALEGGEYLNPTDPGEAAVPDPGPIEASG
ncbi:MAG TPA: chemotaxis protein CheW [Rectinemataceae bacterium]|nr:chemotaxis protein CheW [Rectinemataceae bacterium]